MNGKAKAILAHITIIGWVIALILNMKDRDEFASFYIRQYLGIMIAGLLGNLALSLISTTAAMIWGVIILIAWLISLISAVTDKKNETPVIGQYFQQWFKGL
ncbi:MAG: hypothetical protein COA46_06460 [Porticoccaceae bacterium]|nr:MAG: hypothetical protein COA46_06460 [Porticoccaceae bacterium]